MGLRQENWPATVGIFTGAFAKEAVVGSLDVLYSQLGEADDAERGLILEEEEGFSFWGGLGEAVAIITANLAEVPGMLMDPLGFGVGDVNTPDTAAEEWEVAFSYLLFVLLYFPCVAAMGAVCRGTNWGWTAFAGLWTTGLGYAAATLFCQLGSFSNHPSQSMGWAGGTTGRGDGGALCRSQVSRTGSGA